MREQGGERATGDEDRRLTAILNRASECLQRALTALRGGHKEWAKKEFARMIADCDEAIRIDSRHPKAYELRASAYEHQGEDDKAEADLKWARRLSAR
jgi:Tfp pilus assembly protein PilF